MDLWDKSITLYYLPEVRVLREVKFKIRLVAGVLLENEFCVDWCTPRWFERKTAVDYCLALHDSRGEGGGWHGPYVNGMRIWEVARWESSGNNKNARLSGVAGLAAAPSYFRNSICLHLFILCGILAPSVEPLLAGLIWAETPLNEVGRMMTLGERLQKSKC